MASEDYHFHMFHWHFVEINHSNFHSYGYGLFLLLFFLALLILIPTLFLLAHLCRRHCLMASPVPTATATTLQWFKCEMESMGNRSLGDSNLECCICLSAFQEGAKVKVLPECAHAYHSECVERWLSTHPSCPLCRASLHKATCNAITII